MADIYRRTRNDLVMTRRCRPTLLASSPPSPTLTERVGMGIRYEAAAQRISAADIARLKDIPHSRVLRAFRGRGNVTLNDLAAIAEVLGVRPDQLIRQGEHDG